MSPADRTALVKQLALQMGFDRVGVTPAVPIGRADFLETWLANGYAGSMAYLHRNRESRCDPAALLRGAKSVIVVGLNYHVPQPPKRSATRPGKIARYAWGRDYHKVLKKRLLSLIERLRGELDEPFEAKVCVDTAPIVERELAAAAGVGWIGKNTMVLHAGLGSYFFLGEVVTTLAMDGDAPVADRCGTCTRCLEACPTGAFPQPYVMDASRCIAYLTIEHRGPIPEPLGGQVGEWLYGCDVCQEVCPYNRTAPPTREPAFAPHPVADGFDAAGGLDPADVLAWTDPTYRNTLRGTAMKRATLAMWHRNAAIVLGNRHKAPP